MPQMFDGLRGTFIPGPPSTDTQWSRSVIAGMGDVEGEVEVGGGEEGGGGF